MTVIVEYALDGTRSEWAHAFHELSRYTSFSDAYGDDLASLVTRFSRIAQVRIDDAAFGNGQLFLAWTEMDGRLPPEIDHIRYVCMVDDRRARDVLGYQPAHDIAETIISQLHNYFLHRLINNLDIHAIERAVAKDPAGQSVEL